MPWPGDEPPTLAYGYDALITEPPVQGKTECLEEITYIKVLRTEKKKHTKIQRLKDMEEIKQKITNNYKQTT